MQCGSHNGQTDDLQSWVDLGEGIGDAFPEHLSDGCFEVEQGHAHEHHGQHVGDQEGSSPVFVDQIRKSPEGSKANAHSDSTHDKFPFASVDMRVISVVGLL